MKKTKLTEKNNTIIRGEVLEALPNTMFKLKADDGREILATLKGKLRRSYVRVMPGDMVKIEMTPYDDKRGRIVAKEGR